MDLETITYAVSGGVARVTLNRPDRLNAISPELLRDLDRACAAVEDDPGARVVTLTAAGRAFCAGADLRAVRCSSSRPIPSGGAPSWASGIASSTGSRPCRCRSSPG